MIVVMISSVAAVTAVRLLPVAICNYVVPLIMLTMITVLLSCGIAFQRKATNPSQENDAQTGTLVPQGEQKKVTKGRKQDDRD